MRTLFAFIMLQGSLFLHVLGQTLPIRSFTTDDKLAGRTVTGAIQSRDGFIWITTSSGLSRFDGSGFKNYTHTDGFLNDALKLPFEDSRGRIWVWMGNNEFAYLQNGSVHTSITDTILKKFTFHGNAIPHAIAQDAHGRIWCATSNSFIRLDDTAVFFGEIPPAPGVRLPGFCQFLMGQDSSIRLVAHNQILKWEEKCFSWESSLFVALTGISFNSARGDSILFPTTEGLVLRKGTTERPVIARDRLPKGVNFAFQDRHGNMLLGTQGLGFWQIGSRQVMTEATAIPLLANKKLNRFLLEDHEGNLWFAAADNGLIMVPGGLSDAVWLDKENGLRSNFITATACDRLHNLWFGDDLGNVGVWTTASQLLYILDADPLQDRRRALGILPFADGDVWVGLKNALYRFEATAVTPAYQQQPKRFDFAQRVNDLRAGLGKQCSFTVLSDIYRWDPLAPRIDSTKFKKTALVEKYCHQWTTDGKLWMGTARGLALYSNRRDSLLDAINGHVTSRIQDILIWGGDSLILATEGQGLVLCADGKYVGYLGKAAGLPSLACRKLLRDRNTVWVSTDEGVVELQFRQRNTSAIKTYTIANGLISNVVDAIAVDEHQLMAIGSEGISILPRHQGSVDRVIPFIHIDTLLAGGKAPQGEDIQYADRDVQLKFVGIAYGEPKVLRFQYRLIHNEAITPWNPTLNTSLSFQSLAHGNYVFEVQAAVGDGPWSSSATRRFRVLTPFWQQSWFIGLLILAILSIAIIVFRWRLAIVRRKYQAQIQLQSKITALEHQAIQSMMNPHFIFNVMNSIRHYMQANDLEAADHYLSRFAKLVRSNLTLVAKPLIDLEEETDFLRDYLTLESLRFQDGLDWEINVSPELDEEVLLPSMLLQPFVENSIWHGLLPLKAAGHLRIQFELLDAETLEIRIEDNGVGMGNAPSEDGHVSRGISLTQERLRLLGEMLGRKIVVAYRPQQQNDPQRPGTIVTIYLPLDLHPSKTV